MAQLGSGAGAIAGGLGALVAALITRNKQNHNDAIMGNTLMAPQAAPPGQPQDTGSPSADGTAPAPNPMAALAALAGGQGGQPPQGGAPQGPPPSAAPPMGGPAPAMGGAPAMRPPQGQPPAPTTAPPAMSGTAAPTGQGYYQDSISTMRSIATSIHNANPGIGAAALYRAVERQIGDMKGLAPDQRLAMQYQVGMAGIQQRYDQTMQRADTAEKALAAQQEHWQAVLEQRDRLAAENAKLKGEIEATRQGGQNRRADARNVTSIETTGMRDATSTANAGTREAGQDRRHDRPSGTQLDRDKHPKAATDRTEIERNQSWQSTYRAEMAAGKPAAAAKKTADDMFGRAGSAPGRKTGTPQPGGWSATVVN